MLDNFALALILLAGIVLTLFFLTGAIILFCLSARDLAIMRAKRQQVEIDAEVYEELIKDHTPDPNWQPRRMYGRKHHPSADKE